MSESCGEFRILVSTRDTLPKGCKIPEPTQFKEEAVRLAELLPEDATWSDFVRLLLERQRVEEGIADHEVREKLGLPR